MGALGEIASVTIDGVIPQEAMVVPFMAKHRSELPLRLWVALSNVALFAAAVMMVAKYKLKHALALVFCVTLGGAMMSAWYFFPLPASERAGSIAIGLSMVAATCTLLSVTSIWYWRESRS